MPRWSAVLSEILFRNLGAEWEEEVDGMDVRVDNGERPSSLTVVAIRPDLHAGLSGVHCESITTRGRSAPRQ